MVEVSDGKATGEGFVKCGEESVVEQRCQMAQKILRCGERQLGREGRSHLDRKGRQGRL